MQMPSKPNRGLKNREAFSNSLRKDLFQQLKEISDRTQIPMSKLLDRAVELLLKDFEHLRRG